MNELVIAVVPIRSFGNGKTRLANILSPGERAEVIRQSARVVIDAALDSQVVDTVLVVSPEAEVLEWASGFGRRVHSLRQPTGKPGLNGALDAAREWAIDRDADRLLSLFADLPRLSVFDIRRMLARRSDVVLGPDRRGEGTNALLLRLHVPGPGNRFTFAFGEESLGRHTREAQRLGLSVSLEQTPGIGFDLDTPGDWAEFVRSDSETMTRPPWQLVAAACGAGCG